MGYTALRALPWLEEALSYLERGVYLAEETGIWCYALRKKSEDLLRQCRLWLAESYEGHGKLLQASLQYRELLQTVPPDEQALQRWITMLHMHGETTEALKCYQNARASAEAQGFTLSSALDTLAIHIEQQIQSLPSILIPSASTSSSLPEIFLQQGMTMKSMDNLEDQGMHVMSLEAQV